VGDLYSSEAGKQKTGTGEHDGVRDNFGGGFY
jgi:hypothetical protein